MNEFSLEKDQALWELSFNKQQAMSAPVRSKPPRPVMVEAKCDPQFFVVSVEIH